MAILYSAKRYTGIEDSGSITGSGGGGGASVTVSDTAPSSPSSGDLWFNSTSLKTFVYYADGSSSQWLPSNPVGLRGPAGLTVAASDTAPSSPTAGDVWFDSSVGKTFIYYTDADSSQWIQMNPATSQSSGGSSVTEYANLAAFSSSGNTVGDFAFASDTKALYLWDGTEWDRINSGSDALPDITTALPSTLNINPSANTDVTIAATDPDGFPITYSYDTSPANVSSLVSSVTNHSNGTFTIATTTGSGSFTFRAKANDGVHTTISTSVMTLVPVDNIFTNISPALPGGQTSWDFAVDGSELNVDAGATYTFTSGGQFDLDFEIFGAGGGSTNYNYNRLGGGGGRTTGRTTLEYNQTYTMIIGGKGREGGTTPSGGSQGSGGDGGGANGYGNAGGGDLSGLFKGSGDIATFAAQGHNNSNHTPIAIAGGGGGGGGGGPGGFGGGTTGGLAHSNGANPATGGSQSAGGAGGIGGSTNGIAGSYLIGGQGAPVGGSYTGAGGGGGYFGGGGGGQTSGSDLQSAAGGSGYFNTSLVTNGVTTDGDTNSVALNYLDGSTQTSGKGANAGQDNATDGRVKLVKVT